MEKHISDKSDTTNKDVDIPSVENNLSESYSCGALSSCKHLYNFDYYKYGRVKPRGLLNVFEPAFLEMATILLFLLNLHGRKEMWTL